MSDLDHIKALEAKIVNQRAEINRLTKECAQYYHMYCLYSGHLRAHGIRSIPDDKFNTAWKLAKRLEELLPIAEARELASL